MTLQLTRPLACVDTETTGTDPAKDRVVEVGVVVLTPGGDRTSYRWLVNPGGPIPAEATRVHGISDSMVAGAPTFAQIAPELAVLLAGCDLTGYNLRSFDLPILKAEFARAGRPWPCADARVVDALVIFRDRERHTLSDAVRNYLGREHEGAHGAVADAEATLDVLLAQLARYQDLPHDLPGLDLASGGRQPDWATDCGRIRWDAEGHAVLAFGKHNGKRLVDIARGDRGFLQWMTGPKTNFPDDVRQLVTQVLHGITPRRTGGEAFGGGV